MNTQNLTIYPGSLHNHTQYSNIRLRDCIIKENDLIDYAIQLGHRAVAITDHECISSWVKVEEYADKIHKTYPDFKIIRGNEIYLCRNGLNAENFNKDFDSYYHFILLARDREGAKQLMEISTRAWKRSYMGRGMRRVPTYYQDLIDIIGTNPGHVIASSACLGGCLPKQLLKYEQTKSIELYNKIVNWATQVGKIFGKENFYIELQPSATKEQTLANRLLINFAKEQGFKYIITTDSHYLKKEDRLIHKAYLNAQDGDREVDAFYMTTYMMGTKELESHLDLTREELNEAYYSINEIIDKCEEFSLRRPLRIPELLWRPLLGETYDYQKAFRLMPTLEKFYNSEYKSDRYLVDAILDGIKLHPDLQNKEAYENLEDNLQRTWESSEVNKARWSAYYLNLQRNIDEFWNAGTIVGPARGSGGGFLLLYCLDVIQMDTLRETTKTYPWRFLNPKRESVLDIDTDIEGGRRAQVLQHLRKVYGEDYVANVATFRTEKSKSAILTAARGLGIDVDIAQYIASLIPADRGQLRSLSQCFYGDEENDWPPIKQFVNEMTNNYPELWQVAQNIEGLICGSGLHAGGVIFVDEPFTNSTALMRAPDGTICTQFELHDAEKVSLIKIDALSVEAMDKIHNCLDLLCDAGLVERKATLRETYENVIGLYKLDRTNPDMWEMVLKHKILSLFQMEKQSGISGIALAKPHSVDELAVLNSVIRLMAPEKGAEQPLDMWARYRNNINEWYDEMRDYGLTEEQIEWLSKSSAISSGICESQEGLMQLLQEPRLGGNDLSFADKCRKAIAKKQGKLFEECEQEYFKNAEEKGCEMKLVHYVWDVLLRVQRGYSFCRAHTLAYSLVALQEMNLAHNYPIIFWNCACLINDAGGNEAEEIEEDDNVYNCLDEEYYNEMEDFTEDDESDVEDSYDEDEDCDGYPVEVKVLKNGKKKKKTKTTNYGKIATAIGKIRQEGVDITPPDINRSTYTFSPDVETNTIRYGLSGITRIGEDLVKQIIANRPYSDLSDFLSKNKLTKSQVVNLIKSGAFDSICEDRVTVMSEYVDSIADKKKRITLQNMQMLINHNLIPHEFEFEIKVYNFNKYLKKYCKDGTNFKLIDYPLEFYQSHFDTDLLSYSSDGATAIIGQKTWDNIYQKYMDNIRLYIKKNNETLLDTLNEQLVQEVWDKYCKGSISKWEMDSVSFYSHEHELAKLKDHYYGIVDFQSLGPEPEIERVFTTREGKTIPIFKLVKIAGTVLDKNKQKKTVELLTKSGVVTVKVYGVFSEYDRQISMKDPTTGKKKVIEKSMFSRGNKLIITGIRQDDSFIAKMYKNTPGHRIVQILDVNDDGTAVIKEERMEVPT